MSVPCHGLFDFRLQQSRSTQRYKHGCGTVTNNSSELQYIIILKVGCVKMRAIVCISFYGFVKSQLFTPDRLWTQCLGPCMDVCLGWTQDCGRAAPGCSRVVPKPALCRLGCVLRVIVLVKMNLWPSLRSAAF